MSRFEKLLARIRSLDHNLRFEELRKILEFYGYTMKETRGGSSHVAFRKPGSLPITIPRHGPIKIPYVGMIKDIIESEERR